MEENRELLKEKIAEAKTVGERANQSRSTINYLKTSIESIRREKALHRLHSGDFGEGKDEGGASAATASAEEESPEENTHRRAIEQEKVVYKDSFERLRMLKPEIEHIRKILEKCRATMQSQFDQWYSNLHSRSFHNPHASMQHNDLPPMTDRDDDYDGRGHSSGSASDPPVIVTRVKKLADGDSLASYSRVAESKGVPALALASSSSSSSSSVVGSVVDDDINEDILAFNQAKEALLKRRGASNAGR
jgi:hypothetical protein